jgi:hypothetical protein
MFGGYGVSAMMLMIGAGMTIWTAGSLGCLTAMAGADVAIGLYERWSAKRLGVSEVPPASGEQRGMNRTGAPKTAGDPGGIRWVRGRKPASSGCWPKKKFG